ncbi:element excision factor XisH family protein [Microcoleus sp. LEGE 07076]
MPTKDLYHQVVKQALTQAGWTITHDPYPLAFGRKEIDRSILVQNSY